VIGKTAIAIFSFRVKKKSYIYRISYDKEFIVFCDYLNRSEAASLSLIARLSTDFIVSIKSYGRKWTKRGMLYSRENKYLRRIVL